MEPLRPGADETVRIAPALRRISLGWRLAAAVVVGALLTGSATYWLLQLHQSLSPAAIATEPLFQIETATETQISEHVPTALTVFRFADNPQILVLDFPSLREQGLMLNRVAAFVEKAGLPHDRLLTDTELNGAIRAQGDTVETFYLGHDYAAASLRSFFALADSERIGLNPEEQALRALLRQVGWLSPGVAAALISLPPVSSDPRITTAGRAAILRHELSHGEFFSNPQYAEYVHTFWLTKLTEAERSAIRAFLGKEEYDTHDEELMFNEMQAYLMFTRDPLFFTPSLVGLSRERLTVLQAEFLAGMPSGWLRDVLAGYEPTASAQ